MTKTIPTISKNIKRLRKAKNLSQDKLSRLADVSHATIIKIESGANKNPTIETLAKIAKALGVGVDDLLK
ncbi:MAG: transcriptional regulator [Parcubacteria group bacterium CG23_combo_of_CG06-09_8_20_14_all_35_9]|nr:MAG: transcriptional regulator [Parcubacteria group bacterium CG23_combo_of_CG06-09_8_20_14_all_35_9]